MTHTDHCDYPPSHPPGGLVMLHAVRLHVDDQAIDARDEVVVKHAHRNRDNESRRGLSFSPQRFCRFYPEGAPHRHDAREHADA